LKTNLPGGRKEGQVDVLNRKENACSENNEEEGKACIFMNQREEVSKTGLVRNESKSKGNKKRTRIDVARPMVASRGGEPRKAKSLLTVEGV